MSELKFKEGDRVEFRQKTSRQDDLVTDFADGTIVQIEKIDPDCPIHANYRVEFGPICTWVYDDNLHQPDEMPQANGGHPEYLKLLDEMRELHIRKAGDYGRGEDSLANVRQSSEFGVPAWVGVMVRANDKVHRIKSFVQNGNLKNESVEDSLKDLAAYALIALVLFREQEAKKQ